MSVRMTLDEDGTGVAPQPTPGPARPVPEPPSAGFERVPVAGGAGRRALREARRQRRRLALLCAVVLVACLAMTIMVLGMARDRPGHVAPSGAAAAGSPHPGESVLSAAAPPPAVTPTSPDRPSAAAPRGGTP